MNDVTNDVTTNAHRLLQLFEQMRHRGPGPAFQRLNELNLSFSHVRALHILAPDRTLAMKDLAERLQMTPPSVTALTRRLVQTGMVHRQAHAEDSRIALLSLSDEGRALLKQLYQDQLRGMERLLAALTPEEQELFLSLLERAVQAMRSSAEQQPNPTG
jgi:DNA-binding MarR family transcriptional regulator